MKNTASVEQAAPLMQAGELVVELRFSINSNRDWEEAVNTVPSPSGIVSLIQVSSLPVQPTCFCSRSSTARSQGE